MESSLGYEWISFNQTAGKKDKLIIKKKEIVIGNQQVIRMTDTGM